jgi:pimeloyl-ACP methyl ester carboxylesterase
VSYVDANGVHTYCDEHGSGDPLLLLHGGLVDSDSFARQTPAFAWFDYAIPTADLARIAAPTLVMAGDDDVTRFEHTFELYDTIPEAQLAVIPGASHVVPLEKSDLVNQLVLDFLAAEGATMTMMPLRRASSPMGQ